VLHIRDSWLASGKGCNRALADGYRFLRLQREYNAILVQCNAKCNEIRVYMTLLHNSKHLSSARTMYFIHTHYIFMVSKQQLRCYKNLRVVSIYMYIDKDRLVDRNR